MIGVMTTVSSSFPSFRVGGQIARFLIRRHCLADGGKRLLQIRPSGLMQESCVDGARGAQDFALRSDEPEERRLLGMFPGVVRTQRLSEFVLSRFVENLGCSDQIGFVLLVERGPVAQHDLANPDRS